MRNQKCVFCNTPVGDAKMYAHDAFRRSARSIGMCDHCYSTLMNEPIPGDTSFGKMVAKCNVCGSSIYEKDNGCCAICKSERVG